MKKVIRAGRDPHKDYHSIKFGGWTKKRTEILEQAKSVLESGNKFGLDNLKRYVRYAISEAEAAANQLTQYKEMLENFNSSAASKRDIECLISDLSTFSLKQDHNQ